MPHITDEIKRRVKFLGTTGNYDFIITEIGGTVGDIESLPYLGLCASSVGSSAEQPLPPSHICALHRCRKGAQKQNPRSTP